MPLVGKLNTWHDDRGFGFIAPTHGGREIFVHISAFPRDGSRPTVGEALRYELGRGADGKPQAVEVQRLAVGRSDGARPVSAPGRSRARRVVAAALVLAILAGAVTAWRQVGVRSDAPGPDTQGVLVEGPAGATAPKDGLPAYRCDGRLHCSQMTSCAEAEFFLHHCPGTQMDGDGDGVPCEQQWCSPSWAR